LAANRHVSSEQRRPRCHEGAGRALQDAGRIGSSKIDHQQTIRTTPDSPVDVVGRRLWRDVQAMRVKIRRVESVRNVAAMSRRHLRPKVVLQSKLQQLPRPDSNSRPNETAVVRSMLQLRPVESTDGLNHAKIHSRARPGRFDFRRTVERDITIERLNAIQLRIGAGVLRKDWTSDDDAKYDECAVSRDNTKVRSLQRNATSSDAISR